MNPVRYVGGRHAELGDPVFVVGRHSAFGHVVKIDDRGVVVFAGASIYLWVAGNHVFHADDLARVAHSLESEEASLEDVALRYHPAPPKPWAEIVEQSWSWKAVQR